MVEDLDWHQRATAQPRAFLDKYKQWEASGNRKIASHELLVLTHIFYELVALKLYLICLTVTETYIFTSVFFKAKVAEEVEPCINPL